MEGENKSEKKKRYCMEDGVLIQTVYLSRLVLATEPQEITPFRSMGLEKKKKENYCTSYVCSSSVKDFFMFYYKRDRTAYSEREMKLFSIFITCFFL